MRILQEMNKIFHLLKTRPLKKINQLRLNYLFPTLKKKMHRRMLKKSLVDLRQKARQVSLQVDHLQRDHRAHHRVDLRQKARQVSLQVDRLQRGHRVHLRVDLRQKALRVSHRVDLLVKQNPKTIQVKLCLKKTKKKLMI